MKLSLGIGLNKPMGAFRQDWHPDVPLSLGLHLDLWNNALQALGWPRYWRNLYDHLLERRWR